MARHKLQQTMLVSADDKARPPFPGGWVLAIFEAINEFAPDSADKHRPDTSPRTQVRIKGGRPVKQSTYDEIQAKLVALVTVLFPAVSAFNGFAVKYVNEYFRLWHSAAEIAPGWIKALGHQPGLSGVLARALLRDLVLRLCYLESCDRVLAGRPFSEGELGLFLHHTPAKIYGTLIAERKESKQCSLEKLAGELGLYAEKLRRLKTGKIGPDWGLLRNLANTQTDQRLLAGIGFMDVLLRNFRLNDATMNEEVLQVAMMFFRAHQDALITLGKSCGLMVVKDQKPVLTKRFEEFAAFEDNLLLHAGFEQVWPKMSDALWRAHLYSLQFARTVDIAQAYLQFARSDHDDDDSKLRAFLERAERKSDDCGYAWMRELPKVQCFL
jgi:hypothetical protein